MIPIAYTSQQQKNAAIWLAGVEDWVNQLIYYNVNNYPDALSLAKDPELMDYVVNLYRTRDWICGFLLPDQGVASPVRLTDEAPDLIDQFFEEHDPQDLFNFFNQSDYLNHYILTTEYAQSDQYFTTDPFQPAYQDFLHGHSFASLKP